MTSPRRLPRPLGAVAALAMLVGLLAALWLGVAAPLMARHAALAARAEAAAAQAGRFSAALARAEAAPQAPAPPDAALAGPSAIRAAAELQRRLDAAVSAAGGTLRSAQVLEPVALEGAARVAVTLDARFDTAGLRTFLHAVETGAPLVFVEALEVRRDPDDEAEDAVAVRATLWAVAAVAEGFGAGRP